AKLLYKRPEIQNLSSLKSKFTLIHIKLKEWVTAIKLEHNYTKEEILAIYLNKFEFVNGAHGIQSAARIYFNKDQKDLSIEECALLTGMLQNPSYYNPVRFSKRAKIRRNEVIQKVMAGQAPNIIDSIQDIAVDMSRFRTQEPTEGPAPYFRNEVTKIITEIFDENGIKKPDGSPYNVYLDGLKIYTSIDLEYQSIAEEAMSSHMTWLQDRFWKFWKTRDPLSYSADKETKLARTQNFMRHVKESDRYTDLWSKNMEILEDWPNDMEVNEKIISDLISYETVLPETLKEYAQLLKTNYWKDVKNSYSKHLAEFDSIFNKSIDMEVFDHKNKIKK
ncbi:MAG: transglycosylase domain-containing protein, partial [Saprospiraceae bacterium]|nr:transglycosylase domain-containing protein [Saprospiraceae bacterium]